MSRCPTCELLSLPLSCYFRRLAMAAPARPKANNPRVAGSGTDDALLHENAHIVTTACAAGAQSIAIVPAVAAIAMSFVFEFVIARPSANKPYV